MSQMTGMCVALAATGEDGEAIARAFEDRGATVVRGAGADAASLVERAGESGPDVLVVDCRAAVPGRPVAEMEDADWRAAFERIVDPAFGGIRAALSRMLPRGEGRIIVLVPPAAKLAAPAAGNAAAAHHALSGLVKSVAHEVGPDGIAVNGILVGDGGGAVGRPPEPAETAAVAVMLAGPSMRSVTGTLFPVHGGSVPY